MTYKLCTKNDTCMTHDNRLQITSTTHAFKNVRTKTCSCNCVTFLAKKKKKILSKPHVLITSSKVNKIVMINNRKILMPTDDHQNW